LVLAAFVKVEKRLGNRASKDAANRKPPDAPPTSEDDGG
jgi:hypothetical protein